MTNKEISEQADAWMAVCSTLSEVMPGWANHPGNGIESAVAAIRKLADRDAQWNAFIAGQAGEPVAWRYRFHTDDSLAGKPNVRGWMLTDIRPPTRSGDIEVEPLFASLPAPQAVQAGCGHCEKGGWCGRRDCENIAASPSPDGNAEPMTLADAAKSFPYGPFGHPHVEVSKAEQAEAPSEEREEIEAVIACLGDDAAQLRDENPEDERADNMDHAATLLERLLATQPTASNAGERS